MGDLEDIEIEQEKRLTRIFSKMRPLDSRLVNAVSRKITQKLYENSDRLQEEVYEITEYDDEEPCEKLIRRIEIDREYRKRGHNLTRSQLLKIAGLGTVISISSGYILFQYLF